MKELYLWEMVGPPALQAVDYQGLALPGLQIRVS